MKTENKETSRKDSEPLQQPDVIVSAWISIKDKKPEINEYVLGYRPFAGDYSDELFTVLKYRGSLNVDHLGNTHGFERLHFVSHWQRLVKPQ